MPRASFHDFKASRKQRRSAFTLTEIMMITAICGILIVIAIPAFIRARLISRARTCQENLQKIDSAKEQFAKDNMKRPGDAITQNNLDDANSGNGYLKTFPWEPSGYTYTINPYGTVPQCTSGLNGHSMSEIGRPIQ